jgi:hypothetical protein
MMSDSCYSYQGGRVSKGIRFAVAYFEGIHQTSAFGSGHPALLLKMPIGQPKNSIWG